MLNDACRDILEEDDIASNKKSSPEEEKEVVEVEVEKETSN